MLHTYFTFRAIDCLNFIWPEKYAEKFGKAWGNAINDIWSKKALLTLNYLTVHYFILLTIVIVIKWGKASLKNFKIIFSFLRLNLMYRIVSRNDLENCSKMLFQQNFRPMQFHLNWTKAFLCMQKSCIWINCLFSTFLYRDTFEI